MKWQDDFIKGGFKGKGVPFPIIRPKGEKKLYMYLYRVTLRLRLVTSRKIIITFSLTVITFSFIVIAMTRNRRDYREFLKSPFWLAITEQKKAFVGGKCERCGGTELLQSYHVTYPSDWYKTKLEQLEVLCDSCHRKEHGLYPKVERKYVIVRFGIIPYPGRTKDENVTLHRLHYLMDKLQRGKRLRDRDRSFLSWAKGKFPATEKDGCISAKCDRVYLFEKSCASMANEMEAAA